MTATSLARLRDHREVVRDEDEADAELILERHQQLQDLILDRDVERRRRLVAEEELRLGRERDRDHHALPEPARQLVRVRVGARRSTSGMPDEAHQLERARPAPAACRARAGRAAPRAIWSPTRMTGLSAVIGSWKTMPMRARAARGAGFSSSVRTSTAVERDRAARRCARCAAGARRSRAGPSSCRSPTRRRGRAPPRARTSNEAPSHRAQGAPARERERRRSRTLSTGLLDARHSGLRRSASPSASSESPSAVMTTAMPGNVESSQSGRQERSARR